MSFCVFVYQSSANEVITFEMLHSNTHWPRNCYEALMRKNCVLLARVHGYLFFGNARKAVDRILEKVGNGVEILVLDFITTQHIDDTASHELDRLLSACADRGLKVILT